MCVVPWSSFSHFGVCLCICQHLHMYKHVHIPFMYSCNIVSILNAYCVCIYVYCIYVYIYLCMCKCLYGFLHYVVLLMLQLLKLYVCCTGWDKKCFKDILFTEIFSSLNLF